MIRVIELELSEDTYAELLYMRKKLRLDSDKAAINFAIGVTGWLGEETSRGERILASADPDHAMGLKFNYIKHEAK